MAAYYNEIDAYAAQWLRNLIAAGHIAPGDVDERGIVDVRADDLRGYAQCHFFAGIGGWSLALRLAGWPDDRPVWTGSCPCQPFSAAGAGKAFDDTRHLWPKWFPLIAERRPATVFGEQVEAAIGWGWLDAVFADLESQGYACGASVLPACGVGAPHIRQRLWFVADADARGWAQRQRRRVGAYSELETRSDRANDNPAITDPGAACELADAAINRRIEGQSNVRRYSEGTGTQRQIGRIAERSIPDELGDADDARSQGRSFNRDSSDEFPSRAASLVGGLDDTAGTRHIGPVSDAEGKARDETWLRLPSERSAWRNLEWLPCTDGKARPVEPGTFPLAHGISGRVGRLRAYGNAIVPQVAAQFIRAASGGGRMNAHDPNLIEPILHTAKGEPPQAGMGRFFRDDQGEIFQPDIASHRSAVAVIGVLALDNGKWLARHNGFSIDNPQFPTREAALRCSIARKIKDFRRFARQSQDHGLHWADGHADRMIEWALSVKPDAGEPPEHIATHPRGESDPVREAGFPGGSIAPSTAQPSRDGQIIDPVVAELVAQNRARKAYPAGHVIHHTMDFSDPDKPMSIGACDCSASFAFRPSQHHEMDAAIEAHWQKFDALPDKVDGRGEPIIEGGNHVNQEPALQTQAEAAAQQERSEARGDEPSDQITESAAVAGPAVVPEPARANEAPQPSRAGSPNTDDPDWMLRLAEELAWHEPPADAGMIMMRLADSSGSLSTEPHADDPLAFVGTRIPEKYFRYACREIAKAFKKLNEAIDLKAAAEALEDEKAKTPALFDLAKPTYPSPSN